MDIYKAEEIDTANPAPERLLVAAMLERAFVDYFFPRQEYDAKKNAESAREWIFADGNYSAAHWCVMVDMLPVLAKIQNLIMQNEKGESIDAKFKRIYGKQNRAAFNAISKPVRYRVQYIPKARKNNKGLLPKRVRYI